MVIMSVEMTGSTASSQHEGRQGTDKESPLVDMTKSSVQSEGSVDNPYIPKFISKAPWYLKSTTDLQHQRVCGTEKTRLDSHNRRGVTPHVAIKYRKNACENCGALTHDARSCVERPRKKGAKYTSADICPDEYIIHSAHSGYEASRDRWAGFDPESHLLLAEAHYAEEQEERRNMRKFVDDLISNSDSGKCDGATPLVTNEAVTFDTKDDRTRTTTRNLRIRDDTAKYLINLDVDSAYYDPKSRSLRDDPLLGMDNTAMHTFRGDNEMFTSGDAKKPKELEIFAWEAHQKGLDVSFMAQPTELEFMYKEHRERREKYKEAKRNALLERFGGHDFLDSDKDVAKPSTGTSEFQDSTTAVNYKVRIPVSSKYEEDVHILGHNTVWGSYYDRVNKCWGYKCCRSTVRDAKCTVT